MDYDDTADLLGNREMPIVRPQNSGIGSYFSVRTIILLIVFTLSVGAFARFVLSDMLPWVKRLKDQSARKALRRKYGIPDTDPRPFNVAYSDAAMKREDMQRRLTQRSRPLPPQPPHIAAAGPSNLNQVGNMASGPVRSLTTGSSVQHGLSVTDSSTGHLGNGQHKSFFKQSTQSSKVQARDYARPEEAPRSPLTASQRVRGEAVPGGNAVLSDSIQKRGSEKEVIGESSRNEAKEVIDVDGEVSMEVADAADHPDASDRKAKRGFKRQAGQEEDGNLSSSPKKSGKRARRQSKKHREPEVEDENDPIMDLDPSSVRGKKRDRAEAGSTFGGEDDSPIGHERKSRRRKRKSLATNDGPEGQSRGTKRSFDMESTMDSDEEHISRFRSSRKRGKRSITEPDDSTDISMDDIRVVKDPACGGHKIGEEWEANGQRYKVGPDGRRLRQVLIKKRRSRYSMPADSAHPDSQAQMLVFIESWLNDEQFKEAEERGDIFSPKKPEPADDELQDFTPQKTGKQLLWSSPQKSSRLPRMAFKDSIVTNVGLNINPFERPAETYTRRISSGNVSLKQLPSIGSPSLRQSKSYSKWEKQDLEAEAMAKLRRKLEEEKKKETPATPQPKKVTFQVPSAPSLASSVSAPATTAPPAADKDASSASKPPGFSFAPPTAVNSGPTSALVGSAQPPSINVIPPTRESSTSDPSKPSSFSLPSTQAPKQENSGSTPSAFAPSPFNTNPQSSANQMNPTSQKPPTPAVPNFFAKPAESGTKPGPSAIAPPASMFPPKMPSTSAPASSDGSAFSIKGAAHNDKGQSSSSATPSPFGGQKPAGPQQSNSLLGRVGGFAPQGTNSAFGTPGAGASSTFSFGAPEVKQSDKPLNSSGSNVTTAPKFNFGFTAKPATAAPVTMQPTTAPTASTPALAGKTSAADNPKPANSESAFKFSLTPPAQSSAAASNTASMQRPTSSSGTMFGFGQTSAPTAKSAPTNAMISTPSSSSSTQQPGANNIFGGGTNTSNLSAPSASDASNASKLSFPFGGAGTANAPSTFGSTSPMGSSNAPSPFGAAAGTQNNVTNSPSAFGSAFSTAKASEVPKQFFGGASGLNSSNTNPSTATATPPTETKGKPTFSFNFGASSGSSAAQPSTIFGQSNPLQQSAGGSSTTTTSGPFGVKPAGGSTTFAFGATAGSASNQSPFGANSSNNSPFGGGATSSPFGTATGSSPFAFGSQSSNNNTQK